MEQHNSKIIIAPVTGVTKGDVILVSGTTIYPTGSILTVDLLLSEYTYENRNSAPSTAHLTSVVRIQKDTKWLINFGTAGLTTGKYNIFAVIGNTKAEAAVNIIPHRLVIKPVTDIIKGDTLKITGTTNRPLGNTVTVDLLSADYTYKERNTAPNTKRLSASVSVKSDGTWSVNFTTTDITAGAYKIYAVVGEAKTEADFIIKPCTLTVNPIADVINGDNFVVSGTTNRPVGESVYIQFYNADRYSSGYSASVKSDGTWFTSIGTSGKSVGKYKIYASIAGFKTDEIMINIIPCVISVNPVSDVVSGDLLKISGTANTDSSHVITVELLSQESSYLKSYSAETLTGRWSLDIPTSEMPIGIYKIYVSFDSGTANTVSFSIIAPTKVSIDEKIIRLVVGWNFISIPKTLNTTSNTAASVFDGVETANHPLLTFNGKTQNWQQLSETEILMPMTGYWIYSAEVKDITLKFEPIGQTAPISKNVYKGWNTIGVAGISTASARNLLTGTKWRTIIYWDASAKDYVTVSKNGAVGIYSPENCVYPAVGYWVYEEEDGKIF
ncbi:MAG: hypothetical protein Q4Q53_00205 [Methanocorpusculum sp.]|nr:hypothetical protein [Methanocorpusculum sp.]